MFRLKQTLQQQARQALTQNKNAAATQFYMSQNYVRNFSQFQQLEPRINPTRNYNIAQASQSSTPQHKTYKDIVQNIEKYQQNIVTKTQVGMGLSQNIAKSLEKNKYQNQQLYEIFIQKMDSLYKSELRFKRRMNKNLTRQKLANLYSLAPVKDILRTYNEMSSRGFSSELVAETLKNLDAGIRARGLEGRVLMDYTQPELEQSWRMNKLVDDIIYGLRPEVFFSPHHLGQTTNLLAEISYKSTTLITHFFQKINALIKERETGQKENPLISFNQAVYGGYKNFLPRHYVFKGFENSQDFDQHVRILLDWEGQKVQNKVQEKSPQQMDQEVSELEAAMKELIDASLEVKEVQKDLQATIENVRTQYFKMLEASDKHAFLQENEYIKYDLLELQEMLVKSGYLGPEEALQHLANESFETKMNRASQVFYDYVINYAPEVISPQHEDFYQAAINSISNQEKETKDIQEFLNENHNVLNIGSLSQILAGLRRQALTYRKDVQQADYLNDFYYKFLEPDEYLKYHKQFDHNARKLVEEQHVKMERCYLRPWQIFKTQTDKLIPYMRDIAKKDVDNIDAQLQALHGFAVCGHDEPALRKEIVHNSLGLLDKKNKPTREGIKGGLLGLAMSSTQDEYSLALGRRLCEKLNVYQYEFSDQIDLLWSLCALQLYDVHAFKHLLGSLNMYKFERITNDIKFEEFEKLMDFMTAIHLEAPKGIHVKNKALQDAFISKDIMRSNYKESQILFDPFKKRVVSALAQGLTKASVSHQVVMEDELLNQQVADQEAVNPQKYPYKPDLIMGYKGQKVAMFVLPEMHATRDTYQPNGAYRFRMRLLERAHNNEIKAAAVAVNHVISYDVEQMQVDVNKDFNFSQLLDDRVDGKRLTEKHDFSQLTEFGLKLVKNAAKYQETQPLIDQVQKVDAFIKKIYQIFQMKQQTDLRFDISQRNAGYDQLRFQLMLASIMFDGLNKESKQFVNQNLSKNHKTVKSLLLETANSIKTEQEKSIVQQLPEELNTFWLGTRQEVELPQSLQSPKVQKAIEPEMINQRFMWVQNYFHYKDWKQQQENVFDNFNLLEIPHVQDTHKFYFDQDSYNRRIPQGIFPHPNYKREVLKPATSYAELDFIRSKNNDDLVLFEKEPYKMMVLKEFQKSQQLKPINQHVSMITNLQNIKQGLKADYSDRELLNTILLNLNFTEQLIEEHLGHKKNQDTQPTYLKRDAKAFREFVRSTYDSKDRQDPFTHFYLKEAAKKQSQFQEMEKLEDEIKDLQNYISVEEENRLKAQSQRLQDKIDRVLIEYEMTNEDLYNLSSALPTSIDIQYDVKSLVKSEFVYDIEPELADKGLTDEEYLMIARRRAESKLIKMKIIYKLNKSEELTQNERAYLKEWTHDITQNPERNVLNLRDSLLPNKPSGLSFNDIDANNYYTLNTISKVEIDRKSHGGYALNDLILELSHFLDEEVINKVESELLSDRLRHEWGVTKDFKVVETRNKEISMVLNELEELAFRTAGEFQQEDLQYIKAMLSVARNKDVFDKTFFENDMKSLESFMGQVNQYDNRIVLLERWIRRKEQEIKDRIVLPHASLRKPDQELHQEYDKPLREAREKIVSKILATDEYGNPVNKQYKDLSSRELSIITENLAVRLYMFNYDYPKFLPQVVKAVVEHPNLLRSDKELIQNYCKIFELDWRGDASLENRQQLLFQNPIYVDGTNVKSYGQLTNEVLQDKMRRACVPYVEPLVEKLLSYK